MKVHQFTRGGGFRGVDDESSILYGLTLGVCKRLCPLNAKLTTSVNTQTCFTMNETSVSSSSSHVTAAFDHRSFIRPESCPPDQLVPSNHKRDSSQDETHPGGTRWNPTQEQIGILEMFYKEGMRTPNAQQIEQVAAKLSKYGKIEGKNVFYWFQNHKAREKQKQKQKRNNLGGLTPSPRSTISSTIINPRVEVVESPHKRCKSLSFECLEKDEEQEDDKTLELFPLHPEGRSRSS